MKYRNPVIPGFFPDPSICTDGKKFYLVTSTFQYFPGVALFESENLIEWKQIGNVLTRKEQLPLDNATHSAGIFAPVIRYNEGRFYMITTNVSDGGNFLVYTDDIYGEWSDPVWLDVGGIDPSLCFADGKCYFTGNGHDEEGYQSVLQCEIVPETGEMLTPLKGVWRGNGGRYLEGPHLYKIGDEYYLMAAEGGTEYGHMTIYARSKNPYGPFEGYPKNPVLTNRNLGGYLIQGCGHADLVQDKRGNWWMVHLAFRQTGRWMMHHITGRETYLMPVTFDENGWFTVGENGTTALEVETDRLPDIKQPDEVIRTFANTTPGIEWVYQRNPHPECYEWSNNSVRITGNGGSINDALGSSSFTAIRQEQMDEDVVCRLSANGPEAGITLYMDEEHHYDIALCEDESGKHIIKRLCIGDIRYEAQRVALPADVKDITVKIHMEPMLYHFAVVIDGAEKDLGSAQTRYLSTEVTSGFTGVMIGLYAEKDTQATFYDFEAVRKENL